MSEFMRDILTENSSVVYMTTSDITTEQTVRETNDQRNGAVLVSDGGPPCGIFTERDVLRTSRRRTCAWPDPGCQWTKFMFSIANYRCHHLPVIDDEGLSGMVSIGDIMRHVSAVQQSEIEHLVDYSRVGQRTKNQEWSNGPRVGAEEETGRLLAGYQCSQCTYSSKPARGLEGRPGSSSDG